MEEKVLKVAKDIFKNTNDKNSKYLQQNLLFFIEDYEEFGIETDYQDILDVFTYTVNDGFNIEGFGLFEVPHPSVYVFYNKKTNEMFDICINNFCNKTNETYAAYVDEFHGEHYATDIAEAIQNYSSEFQS